jgi:hypothetical protein
MFSIHPRKGIVTLLFAFVIPLISMPAARGMDAKMTHHAPNIVLILADDQDKQLADSL